ALIKFLTHIIQAQNHILRRQCDRRPILGIEHIVSRQHQYLCFQNCSLTQRNVNSHLVTIKVGVERSTYQRVQLDGFSFYQFGLESLYRKPVKCRSPIEQYGVTLQNIFKDFPDNGRFLIHHFLGRFYRFDYSPFNQFSDYKWLKQFSSHSLGDSTFVQSQIRSNHDHRSTRIIDPLSKKVLPESSLFSLEYVTQRFERTSSLSLHGVGFARVIKQGIHRFLKHPLFVSQNNFWSFDFE